MVKLAIYYELDDAGKDTGRVQIADDEELVYAVFDTEEEAGTAMATMQAECDREDKIKAEYLKWEKKCLARHTISQENLRVFLVNVVLT